MLGDVSHLATDGTLLMAIPAFAPAIVIAGVVTILAVRNRRRSSELSDDDATP